MIFFALAAFFLLQNQSNAVDFHTPTTYHVSPHGLDTAAGSRAFPFKTMTAAAAKLRPGDTLLISPGTYEESLMNVIPSGGNDWNSAITLEAADPTNRPFMNPPANKDAIVLSIEGYKGGAVRNIVLDGVIFDGNSTVTSPIVSIGGNAHNIRLQNCVIRNGKGVGIRLRRSEVEQGCELFNLDVHDNGTTDFHAGVFIESSKHVLDRVRSYNNAGTGIQLIDAHASQGGHVTIKNSLTHHNGRVGDRGAGIVMASGTSSLIYNTIVHHEKDGIRADFNVNNLKIFHNTIYAIGDNSLAGQGIFVGRAASSASIRNNIVHGVRGVGINNFGKSTTINHNLVSAATAGAMRSAVTVAGPAENILDVDPAFADIASNNVRLRAGSPAIANGAVLSEVTQDADNVVRPRSGATDIGAYQATNALRSRIQPTATIFPAVPTLPALQIPNPAPLSYYVNAATGSDGNPGTFARPFKTLAGSVRALTPGSVLFIAPGSYQESLEISIPSGTAQAPVTLKALDASNRPLLQPVGTNRVLHFDKRSTDRFPQQHIVIDGLILDGLHVAYDVVKITNGANHITIQNSVVRNSSNQGILTTSSGSIGNRFHNLFVHNNGFNPFHHGIYISTAANLIEHCSIYDNAGLAIKISDNDFREGSLLRSDSIVRNNFVHHNGRSLGRSGILLSSGRGSQAYNNIVSNELTGIHINYNAHDTKAWNNVVDSTFYGILNGASAFNSEIYNNVITRAEGAAIYNLTTKQYTISHTLFHQNVRNLLPERTVASNSITDRDPLFTDRNSYNFVPKPGSPLINSGRAIPSLVTSINSVPRPQGTAYDIGPFEIPESSPVSILNR